MFSQNIKLLRERHHLTQQEVAEKLNVKPKTYQAWEQNRSQPNATTIIEIGKLYGVALNDLIQVDLSRYEPVTTKENDFITKYNLAPEHIKQAIGVLLGV